MKTTGDTKSQKMVYHPRGIPGYGTGVVRVDSDEHDEYGHITESAQVRKQW